MNSDFQRLYVGPSRSNSELYEGVDSDEAYIIGRKIGRYEMLFGMTSDQLYAYFFNQYLARHGRWSRPHDHRTVLDRLNGCWLPMVAAIILLLLSIFSVLMDWHVVLSIVLTFLFFTISHAIILVLRVRRALLNAHRFAKEYRSLAEKYILLGWESNMEEMEADFKKLDQLWSLSLVVNA